jgi:hypothetical protein
VGGRPRPTIRFNGLLGSLLCNAAGLIVQTANAVQLELA